MTKDTKEAPREIYANVLEGFPTIASTTPMTDWDVRYVRADTVESGDAVAKVVRGECHEGTYPDAKAMTITDADWENFPDGTLLYLHPPRSDEQKAQPEREIIRALQKALFYWMPKIAGEDSPDGQKAAEHAYLLIGSDDTSTECWGDQILQYVGIMNQQQERLEIVLRDAGAEDEEDHIEFIERLAARAALQAAPIDKPAEQTAQEDREAFERANGGELGRLPDGCYRKWSVENDFKLWTAALEYARKKS